MKNLNKGRPPPYSLPVPNPPSPITFPHQTPNQDLFLFIHGHAPGASCMFLLLGRLKRRRKRPAINLLPQAPIPKVAINSSDTFKTARILYIGYALYYTRTCNLVAIYPTTIWEHRMTAPGGLLPHPFKSSPPNKGR